ncbi:MAG: glycoside hydrolase family 65 protein [Candidatus Methanodesulfokora sp.]
MLRKYVFEFNELNEVVAVLTTLTNGFVAIRGDPETLRSEHGTLVSGIYSYTPVFYREIVNLPRVIPMYMMLNCEPMTADGITDMSGILDAYNGIVQQRLEWRGVNGSISYRSTRLVHRNIKPLIALRAEIMPRTSGKLCINSVIELDMKNKLVPSSLAVELFNVIKTSNGNGVKVFIETADRKYSLVIGAVTKAGFEHKRYFHRDSRHVGEVLYSDESRDKYIVEKYIAVHQDESIVDRALDEALNLGWEGVLAQHKSSWNKLWDDMQLEIEGDDEFERSVIFNTYNLLQLYNNDAEHFMLPARGLHGNGYRGHVFWDADIYALPFYLHFMPEAARKMLMYRYRGLEAARENAKLNGYRGAQYPWESADDWHEATPKEVSLDLLGKSKVRIETGELEHHITADVAYSVDLYYRMTGDEEFMIRYGLEILFETARFWASRVEFDSRKGLYVIRNVIGPDEYHIHVDNNFYTNIMARHNLLLGVQYFEECMKRNSWKGVAIRLGLTEKEVNFWREIAANMYVPCGENGFCEEFDGYQELEDVSLPSNWRCIPDGIRTRLNSTKLIKQADVVAALFFAQKPL